MKKKFKYLLLAPLAVASAALVACNGGTTPTTTTPTPTTTVEPTTPTTVTPSVDYDAIINTLALPEDGKSVSADFTVPATIQGQDITWTSSDTSVLKFKETADENAKTKAKTFAAYVIMPTDHQSKVVTLTATIGGSHSATFKVKVNPVDVYTIADAYTFELASGIWADTHKDIPTTWTYEHKTKGLAESQKFEAAISWASDDELITVNSGTGKFDIGHIQDRKSVTLTATFSYNNETTTVKYKVLVWRTLTAQENLELFYDEVGLVKFELKGYVVAKAGYNESYGNGYLNIMDQTKNGGYYVYRAVIAKDKWDALQVGDRVKVSGASSTVYNGLIETNGSTNTEVITDDTVLAPLSADELAALKAGKAADDLFGGFDEIKYQTGNMVKLSGWKIKELGKATAKDLGQLAVLTNDNVPGVEVKVEMAKYSIDAEKEAATAAVTTLGTLKVGDYVDVKGVLYNYNGYEICAVGGDWATKVESAGAATLTAKAKELATFKSNLDKALPGVVTENGDIALTAACGDATVTYALKKSVATATLTGKTLNVHDITAKAVSGTLVVTVSYPSNSTNKTDGYSVSFEKSFTTRTMTFEEKYEQNVKVLFGEKIEYPTEIDLPATVTGEGVVAGVTFSEWALDESVPATLATLANGKLTVNPTSTAANVVLSVKVTIGEEEKTVSVTVPTQYVPTPIADFLAAKDTTTEFVLEGVIVSTRDKGFAIMDAAGNAVFEYGSNDTALADLVVGDKAIITAKADANGIVIASGSSKLIKVLSHNNEVTPATDKIVTVDLANITINDDSTAALIGKVVKVQGYANDVNNGDTPYVYATSEKTGNVARAYDEKGAPNAPYKGKQVTIIGVFRGKGNGFIQIAPISIALVGEAPASEVTYVDKTSVTLQLPESGDNPTAEVAVYKTPWTTSEVTFEITVPAADASKVEVSQLTNGKFTITGKAATAENTPVKVTVQAKANGENLGTAKEISVTVKAYAAPVAGGKVVKYTGTTNTTANAVSDLTATLCLDKDLFTATYNKNGASNDLAIRTDGFRMYATKETTNGNKLTISVKSGTIKSITIAFDSGYSATAVVYGADGTTAITGNNGVYTINGTSFTIYNDNSGVSSNTQVRFQTITIVTE